MQQGPRFRKLRNTVWLGSKYISNKKLAVEGVEVERLQTITATNFI